MSIRVLLVDDQELVREGFRRVLDATTDLEVCGEAGDGVEAVAAVVQLRPDVVVMDVRMPRMDGLEATRLILADDPTVRVLVLTTFDVDEYVYRALEVGASGFLLKDTPLAELVAAIRIVVRGEALLSPGVTRRVIEEFARRPSAPPPGDPLPGLTPRERDVLALVVTGLSNVEIAERLVLSEATVKTHVRSMLTKLDCRDRTQLVIRAYETGFCRPGT